MKKYLVEYNTGDDDMDNWLSITVMASSPEHAVLVARNATNDEGIEYVCAGEI